jgi:hypothetical protein
MAASAQSKDLLGMLQSLSNEEVLLYASLGLVLVCKSHIYRYLRIWLPVFAVVALGYRAYLSEGPTLLAILQSVFAKYAPTSAFFLSDFIGLTVVWSVVSSAVALLSLDLVGAKKDLAAWAFNQVRMTSLVQGLLSKEQDKLEADFDKELKVKPIKPISNTVFLTYLHKKYVSFNTITGQVQSHRQHQHISTQGRPSAQRNPRFDAHRHTDREREVGDGPRLGRGLPRTAQTYRTAERCLLQVLH